MVFQHAVLKGKLDSGPHMVAVAEAQLLALGSSPLGGYTPAKPMVLPIPFLSQLKIQWLHGLADARALEWNCQ